MATHSGDKEIANDKLSALLNIGHVEDPFILSRFQFTYGNNLIVIIRYLSLPPVSPSHNLDNLRFGRVHTPFSN